MSDEFVRIAKALQTIGDYVTELEMGETDLAQFIDRAQRHCEACEQPTRDALLMVMAGISVAVMSRK